jgi:hypothetical protein
MNITSLKSTLSRKFRGATLDDVQGISDYSLFKEAASNLLSNIDPIETLKKKELFLYKDVFDYAPETDLKKIVDIRPQANRFSSDNFTKSYIENFDLYKKDRDFTIEFNNGSKVLRISREVGTAQEIDSCNELDTWAAGGGASNLAEDDYITTGGGSLMFDLGATGGYIENTGYLTDLSGFKNQSAFFVWVYIPDPTIVTSAFLYWGDDSTDYWSQSVTTPHFGSFRQGWNLIRFDWNDATENGSPDETAVDFIRFGLVTTSADTNIRIDDIQLRKPVMHEVVYYSQYLFRNTAGTFLETPTADEDIINLEPDAENLFVNECCILIADGLTRAEEAQKYTNALYGTGQKTGLYANYKASKPAEPIRAKTVLRPIRRIRQFGSGIYKQK